MCRMVDATVAKTLTHVLLVVVGGVLSDVDAMVIVIVAEHP